MPRPSRSTNSNAPSAIAAPSGGDVAQLIEAGQAADRRGQRQEARACYEAALYRLDAPGSESRAATLLRWIARSYMMDGNPDAATDCAEAALAVARASGDRVGEGHAINVHAVIRWAQGDLDGAESLYLVARTCALSAGERSLVAMTSNNLGIIANIRGDLPEALHHYSVGLENYRALELPTDVCTALNNMGRLHTDLRRWTEAERDYTEAIEISNAIGDKNIRVGLEVNVAEMWLSRHNAARAALALDNAASLSTETGNCAWEPHIAKLRGILHRNAGAAKEAEEHFARAVEISESRQDVLLLAETLRERAELYRGEGRNREALQNLNRSHRLFTQLQAKRELANVDRSVSRLEDDFINVVERWGESIEAKDRYTQGHCVRVANLSCAIAAVCGIDGQSLFWFRIGALLHDVGKLVVPSEVLNKPGKLDADEWQLMRSHPTAGVDMLAGIDFPWDVRPLIESHHERWDGKGYPHGLSGEAIPLAARILAVADVYDALTSIRSYKTAMTHDAAMDIMRRDVGAAFDPAIFATFEEVVRDGVAPEPLLPRPRVAGDDASPARALELSTGDRLTGLPMRPSMERIASQALTDRRTTNGALALLVVELDAEASAWRARTDAQRRRVLLWIGRDVRGATRTSDFVARTGDLQFMALLPGSTAQHARSVMLRVQSTLSRRLRRSVTREPVSGLLRMAVVSAPEDGDSTDELFAAAERACAKRSAAARVLRA